MATACRNMQGLARQQRPAPRAPRAAAAARFVVARPSSAGRQLTVVASSERDSNFMSGFIMGGVVFGTLGFLFAPQISRALLGDDQRLRLPRFMEEEGPKDPEATKQELIDKIAQLNASIDEVASSLKRGEAEPATAEVA
ncbi:hypothetical protein Rsub_00196 [Raphidocelis subcapitata]|uniref:Uncharacterized protein n=1 Tax=Raphidocelis subcapitata TaxID=307507 RepID=A0A2V0NRN4_9CHLO|nr:hypothetical protein Rsub_00196 [Raphidocelis subcapitata]|eukprot:GBF87485.1 hypothetical protein Rsub_00196 [Raphidocelis subcapitata]